MYVLISQRLREGHTARMTMGQRDVFHYQGGVAGHKTAGGVRDPLLGLGANSHITLV